MLRVMVDSMVFDRLTDDPAAFAAVDGARRHGALALFTTPVQEAQVAAVPDPRRRKQLRRLPREVVPPAVPYDPALASKHDADAVIAATTAQRCDVLVTEDRRLTAEALAAGIETWPTTRLLEWLGER